MRHVINYFRIRNVVREPRAALSTCMYLSVPNYLPMSFGFDRHRN